MLTKGRRVPRNRKDREPRTSFLDEPYMSGRNAGAARGRAESKPKRRPTKKSALDAHHGVRQPIRSLPVQEDVTWRFGA